MMIVGSLVLSTNLNWSYGMARNYHTIPGRVIACLEEDLFEVRWADGHVTLSSVDELRLAPSV